MRQLAAVTLALLLLAACGRGGAPEPTPEPAANAPRDARVTSFDGVPIVYTVTGQGEGALLFIHCWSCDRGYWEAQVEEFARDFRVITVDLAGHGDSGAGRTDWSIDALGRDVEAVVDDLQLASVVLIGHSLGGPVALAAARNLPGRVVGVIGVDTLHDAEYQFPEEQKAGLLARYERDFRGTCDEFVHMLFAEGANAELVGEVATDICAAPPEIAIALLKASMAYDVAAALEAARVPVRCINSTALMKTNLEANRRHAPDFDAYLMDGVGHFPMLEQPVEFNRLLRQAIEELTSSKGA